MKAEPITQRTNKADEDDEGRGGRGGDESGRVRCRCGGYGDEGKEKEGKERRTTKKIM